jgi:hypothetical protein
MMKLKDCAMTSKVCTIANLVATTLRKVAVLEE